MQEALTNALKHAGPARAEVVIRYGDRELNWPSPMTAPPVTPDPQADKQEVMACSVCRSGWRSLEVR